MPENKIIEFQYKILHQIIGTNKLLYKMGKTTSPNCEHCMMHFETIEHLFYNCFVVRNFWMNLFSKWNMYKKTDIKPSKKDILLGMEFQTSIHEIPVNILLLYGKKYVYLCKLQKESPNLEGFFNYMCCKCISISNTRSVLKTSYEEILTFILSCKLDI